MHYLKFAVNVESIFMEPLKVNSITGFLPIANPSAKILILGSIPSQSSLLQQQYYAHPRNAFWPIMLNLFGHPNNIDKFSYSERVQLLLQNNIAVWDVLKHCERKGSLDAAIKMDSIKTNNFYELFTSHSLIKKVCFNGAKAEAVYNQHVLPNIKKSHPYLQYIKLPSTSPAYAAMSLQQKMIIWSGSVSYNMR